MREVHDVEPLAADELVAGGAVLVDVREPDEYEAGHAPGAVLIPIGELEGRVDELANAGDVVCVCRTGARSAAAAEFLRGRGLPARNLTGGMFAWAAEGLPVASSHGGSGTVI
jgi:rhodanese-related sulfurtransferase